MYLRKLCRHTTFYRETYLEKTYILSPSFDRGRRLHRIFDALRNTSTTNSRGNKGAARKRASGFDWSLSCRSSTWERSFRCSVFRRRGRRAKQAAESETIWHGKTPRQHNTDDDEVEDDNTPRRSNPRDTTFSRRYQILCLRDTIRDVRKTSDLIRETRVACCVEELEDVIAASCDS